MATLKAYTSWCQELQVSADRCIVVEGVLKVGYSKGTIENQLKGFGSVKVLEERASGDEFLVLCIFSSPVSDLPIPSSLAVAEGITWKLVHLGAPPATDGKTDTSSTDDTKDDDPPVDFGAMLNDFFLAHGMDPGKFLKSSSDTTDDVPPAVKKVVEHVVVTSAASHRRIRPFSGRLPVPNGEWEFVTWDQVVTQSVLGGGMPSHQRRSAIIDSLLPPALDVARDPSLTTPEALVEALQKAYGEVKDGDDLYAEFRDTYQVSNELPSAFLVRLNGVLQQVVRQGGLTPGRANRSRLDQFLRGCLFQEDIIAALNLRSLKGDPPSYVDLLQMLRAEEARHVERERRRQVSKVSTTTPKSARVHEQTVKTGKLEQQMAELKSQLAALQMVKPAKEPAGKQMQARGPYRRQPLFCYKCGQDGHGMNACNNPVNATLVQKKLADRVRKSGNEREPPSRDEREAR